jgi:uncharacterized LabA/DUF88 family protein
MKSGNNIYAFIDSQNLNLGVRSAGWMLDFRKFRVYLKEKYGVDKAYLFIGHIPENEKLYAFLKKSAYILVFKPTLEFRKGHNQITKGNVDAELVLHTMIAWNNFDKAIIVSGDGDFYCLIDYLEEKNKLLKLLVPTKRFSGLLRRFNQGNFIGRVDLLKKSLEYKKKTGIRGRSKP